MNSLPFKMNFIFIKRTGQTRLKNYLFQQQTSSALKGETQTVSPQDKNAEFIFVLKQVQIMNPGHQPQRFKVFNYLPNQRAFTIKGSTHVFRLDRYGGWFDEHGNYYNYNVEPNEPPSSSQSYSNQGDNHSRGSSDSDQFEKEFGRPGFVEDDEDEEEANLMAMAKNLAELDNYTKNSWVRVFFSNLGYHSNREEIIKVYSKKTGSIENVILDRQENQNKGTGYFIAANVQTAANLIHLQGVKVIERPLFFSIEPYFDYLLNPISHEELKEKDQPKYVPEKIDSLSKISSKKQQSKIESSWSYYKFQKDIFPKKSTFKIWMEEHGLIFEQDFKNVQKIENDEEKKYAKVEMKVRTFQSINGLSYNGQPVRFIPFQK